jgi:hypothetical protein
VRPAHIERVAFFWAKSAAGHLTKVLKFFWQAAKKMRVANVINR